MSMEYDSTKHMVSKGYSSEGIQIENKGNCI